MTNPPDPKPTLTPEQRSLLELRREGEWPEGAAIGNLLDDYDARGEALERLEERLAKLKAR